MQFVVDMAGNIHGQNIAVSVGMHPIKFCH